MALPPQPPPDDPQLRIHQERERLAKLAYWLDDRFRIPGTNWRIGADGLVGLIPGVGDGITTAVSAYLVLEARRLGISKAVLMRMIWNVAIDGLVGTVPLVGDLFDIRWKANRKNMQLLNEHLAKIYGPEQSPTTQKIL
ncbi:hypothetical protein Noc_1444 [Nitrosococcus oceani ATCC 19707]|uniref:DUF4112 domain-containing protein n=2 Tax=Nitrosococcus oceani TaxID=1229 RepID=Q3JB63_NITOC|nr:DUF4112 domain-containing protein [Nitrosococcus oceani]ABA57933.1 hypothetical protein Noc_1444 [Nitrosococcus oceani ATCC 19707]GEM19576.1 hypothetical protein NONS58_09680 [Nitrosococcus oceani]